MEPVKFHMKSKANNIGAPLLYLTLQIVITCPIIYSVERGSDLSTPQLIYFLAASVVTIIAYFITACTNPGYI